jgi:hypothetical protein
MSQQASLPLDLNLLAEESCNSLSWTIERATSHLEELEELDGDEGNEKTHAITTGTVDDRRHECERTEPESATRDGSMWHFMRYTSLTLNRQQHLDHQELP